MGCKLDHVPETLLLPLYGRAQMSCSRHPLLVDHLAARLVDSLDCDFSAVAAAVSPAANLVWAARAWQFDRMVREFAAATSPCTVVNIGAGLDTSFHRVDDGAMRWFDLDLPEVIKLRRDLIPETDRSRCIAQSLFDPSWIDALRPDPGRVFLFAAGVFFYFDTTQLQPFFAMLHERLPGSTVAFDALSTAGVRKANRMVGIAKMEKAEVKWALDDARVMEGWGAGIRSIEQFPVFRGIHRKGMPLRRRLVMWIADTIRMSTIVRCVV